MPDKAARNPLVGRTLRHYSCLPSTNTHAVSFSNDPDNHGLVITADSQTAGRGQYDRTWSAPPGSSILMSVLLFPPPELRRPAILTAWAAVSVCEMIQIATGLDASIKWPNDVLIRGRKICGILCEGGARHVVAGIGLNVNQSAADFEHLGLPTATSLAIETGSTSEIAKLTGQLIHCLDAQYDRLARGEIAALEADWRRRLGLLGKVVVLERMDGHVTTGRLLEMSFDAIEIATADGARSGVIPETIRHVNPT